MKKATFPAEPANHVAVFQETTIRRVWHNSEWWFSVVDVVGVLTDSADPRQYMKKMRSRDPSLDANWGTTCTPLALKASDGKMRETNCANTEGLFRIIQSIPSPKAEPFKRWLAQVGYERVKEIENPELASARARELYQAKGYPQAWIEKRLRSISVRGELTDEWKARGVAEGREYSILTAEIARATFGVTPTEHSQLKGLDSVKTGNNLRDHMTDLELIFTMLGEASTTEIARRSDAMGFDENRTSAKEGGKIAGNARKALEAKTGKKVVSKANYLSVPGASDLLEHALPTEPTKSKPRVRIKPPKGSAA
ncbi:BRO-N domain-containing protein [Rhodoferax fermentans]|uniref:Phage antirepressor protein n=1 Tax=Rhodoferax fermentans TaxID=28066 RepID=A0A1T1AWR3_RHOFE|nr:Bro-N domain-containing protein [Rhodoferax fermentans]MBK1685136.1 phage antirepressor protein [Rhodoferax fermentans]OOV08433.1 phage antirepressor protein [Rhodoferax fermentans]